MTRRLACLLVVVAVAAGACGSRTRDPLSADDSTPSGGAGEQAFTGAAQPDQAGDAPAAGDAGGAGDAPTATTSPPDDDARAGAGGGGGDGDAGNAGPAAPPSGPPPASTGIVTGVEPVCPARGDVVTMTMETVPFADITYAASFADGRHHNVFGLAQAGPNGEFTLTFAVPADAAEGDGQVIAGAAHPSGGGGEGRGYFRVEGEVCE